MLIFMSLMVTKRSSRPSRTGPLLLTASGEGGTIGGEGYLKGRAGRDPLVVVRAEGDIPLKPRRSRSSEACVVNKGLLS